MRGSMELSISNPARMIRMLQFHPGLHAAAGVHHLLMMRIPTSPSLARPLFRLMICWRSMVCFFGLHSHGLRAATVASAKELLWLHLPPQSVRVQEARVSSYHLCRVRAVRRRRMSKRRCRRPHRLLPPFFRESMSSWKTSPSLVSLRMQWSLAYGIGKLGISTLTSRWPSDFESGSLRPSRRLLSFEGSGSFAAWMHCLWAYW
mmetsp:Transcript_52374/g.117943  ORF Transcript_52374/g.117943 Transcript_52374/m.117943 type:complete len:204 (-) Transcript_52374:8-619(-)